MLIVKLNYRRICYNIGLGMCCNSKSDFIRREGGIYCSAGKIRSVRTYENFIDTAGRSNVNEKNV